MARTRSGYVVSAMLIGAVVTGSSSAVSIETVLVGNPGNHGDPSDGDVVTPGVQNFGAVPYSYRMGKYEVTNAQYVEFLNAKDPTGANALALYSDRMTTDSLGGIAINDSGVEGSKYDVKPGRGNNPVNFVTWVDAIRFVNWLHNGQGDGDPNNGAYTILGGGGLPYNPDDIHRLPGAKWFLPSEDEWYKAAYYDPRSTAQGGPSSDDNYWSYPTQVDSFDEIYSDDPNNLNAPDPTSTGNFHKREGISGKGYDDGYAVSGDTAYPHEQNPFTNVGAYNLSRSYYGTFDQAGNVAEMTDTFHPPTVIGRVVRGGAWNSLGRIASRHRTFNLGAHGRSGYDTGFRVATIVPEPSVFAMISLLIRIMAGSRFICRSDRRSG